MDYRKIFDNAFSGLYHKYHSYDNDAICEKVFERAEIMEKEKKNNNVQRIDARDLPTGDMPGEKLRSRAPLVAGISVTAAAALGITALGTGIVKLPQFVPLSEGGNAAYHAEQEAAQTSDQVYSDMNVETVTEAENIFDLGDVTVKVLWWQYDGNNFSMEYDLIFNGNTDVKNFPGIDYNRVSPMFGEGWENGDYYSLMSDDTSCSVHFNGKTKSFMPECEFWFMDLEDSYSRYAGEKDNNAPYPADADKRITMYTTDGRMTGVKYGHTDSAGRFELGKTIVTHDAVRIEYLDISDPAYLEGLRDCYLDALQSDGTFVTLGKGTFTPTNAAGTAGILEFDPREAIYDLNDVTEFVPRSMALPDGNVLDYGDWQVVITDLAFDGLKLDMTYTVRQKFNLHPNSPDTAYGFEFSEDVSVADWQQGTEEVFREENTSVMRDVRISYIMPEPVYRLDLAYLLRSSEIDLPENLEQRRELIENNPHLTIEVTNKYPAITAKMAVPKGTPITQPNGAEALLEAIYIGDGIIECVYTDTEEGIFGGNFDAPVAEMTAEMVDGRVLTPSAELPFYPYTTNYRYNGKAKVYYFFDTSTWRGNIQWVKLGDTVVIGSELLSREEMFDSLPAAMECVVPEGLTFDELCTVYNDIRLPLDYEPMEPVNDETSIVIDFIHNYENEKHYYDGMFLTVKPDELTDEQMSLLGGRIKTGSSLSEVMELLGGTCFYDEANNSYSWRFTDGEGHSIMYIDFRFDENDVITLMPDILYIDS